MIRLSARQADVLEYIKLCTAVKGYPPTLRELCVAMGIGSTNGVNDHLRALERTGYIRREPRTARSIRVVERPRPSTL